MQVVTQDAELANRNCPENVRKSFSVLFQLGKDKAGRDELREHLHLCSAPKDAAQVSDVAYWIQVSGELHETVHACTSSQVAVVACAVVACLSTDSYLGMPSRLDAARSFIQDDSQGAFDAFAMGNYPYETYYIGGSEAHPLPAWPMRAACSHLSEPGLADSSLLQASCA